MKTTAKYLTLLIILCTILPSHNPAQAAAGMLRNRTTYLASKLKHMPSKKFVLKLGTAAVVAYMAHKSYKSYTAWAKSQDNERKAQMAETLRTIAMAAKLDHEAYKKAFYEKIEAERKAAAARQQKALDDKAAAEQKIALQAQQESKNAAASAASGEEQAKKIEHERNIAAQLRAEQKKEADRKAAANDLAAFTSYSHLPQPAQPAPTVILAQYESKVSAASAAPAREEKHTFEQKIEEALLRQDYEGQAEHMLIPLEPAQKTIIDLYNLGREYVARIYRDEAASVPQATLEQFRESLRAIMWFLYIVSEEKSQCAFEEGTICIHDTQNKLYNFLRTNNLAQERISTHFAEFETPADSPRRLQKAEERKKDYGIDVYGLPTDKQHILFGKLKEEFCYIKLENYGLGITGLIPHGYEAFLAYIRKIKTIRNYTGMVSDDHATFRKERVPEDIAAKSTEHLARIKLEAQEHANIAQQFKKFGIRVIVPFFELYAENYPDIATWINSVKTQYPDYKYRKGREVILTQEEILAAPAKNPSISIIVLDE
jgi:chemotaxis protein histidine kinase CheA